MTRKTKKMMRNSKNGPLYWHISVLVLPSKLARRK